MNLTVFSDSHEDTLSMLEICRAAPPDRVVFCGDGSAGAMLLERRYPLWAVKGNCDASSRLPDEQIFTLGGLRIAVTHGHRFNVKAGLESAARYYKSRSVDILFFGHTHLPFDGIVVGVRLINPGSVRASRSGSAWGLFTLTGDRTFFYEQKQKEF